MLLVSSVSAALILALSIGWLFAFHMPAERASAREDWLIRLRGLAEDRRRAIDAWVRQLEESATASAALLESLDRTGTAPLQSALAGKAAAHGYRALWIVDRTGAVRAGMPVDGRPSDRVLQLIISAIQRDTVVATFSNQDGAACLVVVVPHSRRDGAVVILEEARSFVFPLLAAIPFASSTAETLLGERVDDSIRFVSPLRKQSGPALRQPWTTPTPMRDAISGTEHTVEAEDYAGAPVLAVTRRLERAPFGLVAKADLHEVYAAADRENRMLLAAMLALALGLAGLLTGAWRGSAERERRLAAESMQRAEARAARELEAANELLRAHDEQLRDSLERLDAILGTMAEAVVFVDRSGRIDYANAAAEHILGVHASELPDRTFDDPRWQIEALEGGPFPPEQLPFNVIMRTEAPVYGVEHAIVRPEGTRTILSINAGPLRAGDGTIAGMVASVEDVTLRKQAEHRLQRLNEELEERVRQRTTALEASNRELEAFAYSVSHDLRAPLRALDGFSQALIEDYGDRLDADALDYLRRIRAASQRMAQLIDELLRLSRISRQELARQPIDLVAMVRAALAELRAAHPDRCVELIAPPALPACGDPALVQIVIDNLVGNAWKFTAPRACARIEIGTVEAAGPTRYFVRDNGVGFDVRHAAKLFGAFQRLHRQDEFPGTGIGLATVQRIIHRHGGDVEATAEPDAGAVFSFTLG